MTIILVTGTVVSCTPPSKYSDVDSVSSLTESYHDSEYGYSIKYPDDWQRKLNSDNGTMLSYVSEIGDFNVVMVTISDRKSNGLTIEEEAEREVRSFQDSYNITPKEVTFKGYKALDVDTFPYKDNFIAELFVQTNTYTYVLIAMSSDDGDKTFETILGSFEIDSTGTKE